MYTRVLKLDKNYWLERWKAKRCKEFSGSGKCFEDVVYCKDCRYHFDFELISRNVLAALWKVKA